MEDRFTFGIVHLQDGIPVIPMIIGLLVVSEVFVQLRREAVSHAELRPLPVAQDPEGLTARELPTHLPTIVKSGALGTIVGAIPGLGATVGAFIAYSEAQPLAAPGTRCRSAGARCAASPPPNPATAPPTVRT